MIYRPHFTYIEAATPEQKQAREAAANEEWRRRLIFHFWHPSLELHRTSLSIVRPHQEWRRRLFVMPEWHYESTPRPQPHNIRIVPFPIIRPYENRQEHEPPHGTPVRTPVGTPVRLPSDIHILPSPQIRQEQQENNGNHPIGITKSLLLHSSCSG